MSMTPVNDITIVTAFFDIGRGTWTHDKGHPHHLYRTNETYIERFSHLTKFDNAIILFTSPDLVEKVESVVGKDRVTIIPFDYHNQFVDLRNRIRETQQNPEYQRIINPYQVRNPEYWSPDYVLVNALKSYFVNEAIEKNLVNTELAAWVDFGYCRDIDSLYGKRSWKLDFDPEKVHLFYAKLPDLSRPVDIGPIIVTIILNNDVHIIGGAIVGGKTVWKDLYDSVIKNANFLMDNKLIDDDQTLMLISYVKNLKKFVVHHLDRKDSLVVFKQYNNSNY